MSGADDYWPAPAKLNLFLHVVGRRCDGYHLLQTVFQFLDYGDELSFERRADGKLRLCHPLPGVPLENDLVWRTARLLQATFGPRLGADLELRKRLPMGGGLGGGSSDAATTLHGLNKLWDLGLATSKLAKIGLQLGADVPVFVHGLAAWAEGVGEQLTPLELAEPWFVVLNPEVAISTGEIFAASDLTRNTPLTTMSAFRDGGCHNDCEPVVFRRYPAVAEAARWLSQFGVVRLTGTGGCLFCTQPDEQSARRVAERIRQGGYRGFAARGCNRSGLLERLSHGG
jgi:4-diphosphocytidyl-2-C-methyl-D-erythritol kinase